VDCGVWQEFFDNGNGKSWVQCGDLRNDPCSCVNSDFGDLISCNADGHITQIMLFGNGVEGSLPRSIGNLSQLNNLNLWDNYAAGPLPDSLCGLSQLSAIRLGSTMGNNNFTGTIPSCLGELPKLEEFSVRGALTGSIPESFAKLALKELLLSGTSLTGKLPALTFTQMDECSLRGAKFACPLPGGAASKCHAQCQPSTVCVHSEDTEDHKCTDACAAKAFKSKGLETSGKCPSKYSTVDKQVSEEQCPDGVTNLRYCQSTKLNVTVTTRGMASKVYTAL